MADSKISDLAAVSSFLDTDEFVLASAGASKKITGANLKASIGAPTVKLFDSILGSDAPSIDTGAGGIAAGYGCLLIDIVVRTDAVGALVQVNVRVNNDSGNNYDRQYIAGLSATAQAQTGLAETAWQPIMHGSGGTANYPGFASLVIPSYDKTTFFKVGSMTEAVVDGTAANEGSVLRAIGWRSTAAISRLAVSAQSGNLKTGSRLLIYGTPG